MAQTKPSLQQRAPQINVSMLQPRFFVDRCGVVNRERDVLRTIVQYKSVGAKLDRSGGVCRIGLLARRHATGDPDDVLPTDRLGGGVILHVPSGEVVLQGLAMPHSPRLYDGRLYFTLAANGELCCADVEAATYEVVNRVPGFARGLARCGDYLFVGHSRLRKKHLFGDLPLVDTPHHAGVVMVHLPSGTIAGAIRYHTSCEEIYDVHVLEGVQRPGILGVEDDVHRLAIAMPEGGYWAKPEEEDTAGALS